ncbi:hypothetical protein MES4922_110228 [Mesorhizobium ventifaucium]|uniref:Uncharacterized protein n=1 Tax=Mesorhizobium ventifaucium TaxID=666020 RepID=A0ABN8J9H7_9HYPH|nr:hypothetical protein MES4922_110228 [Mesorhizobium ventifaucium]
MKIGESIANSIAEVPDCSLNWHNLRLNWRILRRGIEIVLVSMLFMSFAHRDIPEPSQDVTRGCLKAA